MGIVARMERERVQASVEWTPLDDRWYMSIGASTPSIAGPVVSPEAAMRVTTVYACVRILAETMGQLPIHVYRHRDDGGKEKAKDYPLSYVLRHQPNPWQGSYTWRETLQGHAGLRGTGYSVIMPGRRGA